MRRLPTSIVAAGAMLAGCAHTPPRPPVELLAAGDERMCRFEVEGQVVGEGSPTDAGAMLARAARRWRGRSVIILSGAEIPYKCFGTALFVLQREMGNGRIGFISEPPPAGGPGGGR